MESLTTVVAGSRGGLPAEGQRPHHRPASGDWNAFTSPRRLRGPAHLPQLITAMKVVSQKEERIMIRLTTQFGKSGLAHKLRAKHSQRQWACASFATLVFITAVFRLGFSLPQDSVTAAHPGTIIDLGTLGGDFSDANGINNDPTVVQVVGLSTIVDNITVHAFFWTPPGPMIDLGTLGGDSNAFDINNYGQIAGGSVDVLHQNWAVVWTMTGNSWTVETLPKLTGACCANANGINNGTAGDRLTVAVVGSSTTTTSGEFHAVVWKKSAAGWAIQDLGTLPGHRRSVANDVNDHEAIVGTSFSTAGVATGFLWTEAGGMFALSTLGGETYALAINNNGDVAGFSTDAVGHRHAVQWRAATNWTIEDFGTRSEGYGINGLGDVVGVRNKHAFLANSSGMIDLGALRGPGSSVARDLNDFDSVVGASASGNKLHAALWKLN
jgi:probable HAF family extracellular repeat protein